MTTASGVLPTQGSERRLQVADSGENSSREMMGKWTPRFI